MATVSDWQESASADESELRLPPATDDHFYVSARLITFGLRHANSKGATFDASDFPPNVVTALVGRSVSLEHDKSKILGNVRQAVASKDGIDCVLELDRTMCAHHGIDPSQFGNLKKFPAVSVELTRNPDASLFVVHDGTKVHEEIPAREAEAWGIRRTTKLHPVYRNGHTVSERMRGASLTGVGIVARPADQNAKILRMVASDNEREVATDAELISGPAKNFEINLPGLSGIVGGMGVSMPRLTAPGLTRPRIVRSTVSLSNHDLDLL